MLRKMKNKKAYYFTLDAFIALIIILAVLLVIKPMSKQETVLIQEQDDLITLLSTLQIGEIDNLYVKQLIAEKKADENLSLLEQITEFYAKGMPEAQLLSQEIFSVLQPKENIGIWFNNELIASSYTKPFEDAKEIFTARQIISGIEKPEDGDIKGYSARAFLTRSSQVKYFYFGGYIGDGNISVKIDYQGEIKNLEMEIATNRDFKMYINDILSGQYEKSPSELIPARYTNLGYLENFQSGTNIIKLTGVGGNLYIAGGYIKIVYENSGLYEYSTKYNFPGIDGIINLYDGFYIRGSLNSLDISLHLNSKYTGFLTLGNKIVFNDSTIGEETISLTNSQLSSLLNYQELSKKTIPIRLGLEEIQGLIGGGNADVILITDLSDSMDFQINSESLGITRSCSDPNLYNLDTKRISLAKCLDKMFIDIILNVSGNRIGLVGFYGDVEPPRKGRVKKEDLSSNADYLKQKIDETYIPQGGTPICAAINTAYRILNEQSKNRRRFVIVMTDGIPTHHCGSMGADQCKGTRTGLLDDLDVLWLGHASCHYLDSDVCEGTVNDCDCGIANANWSSCRIRNNLNATVYSIGFGPVADCYMAGKTLQNIATCGNGSYYSSSNPEILKEIYKNIAAEILSLSYVEQISDVEGLFERTILYPDSYIKFSYTAEELPYGLLVTSEQQFQDKYSGVFNIPSDSQPIEAKLVSYSGPKWTKYAEIDSTEIYNLSNYGSKFVELGDPYVIEIPIEKVNIGDNLVKLITGISPSDSYAGSEYNKIIYKILKEAVGYSPILSSAKGCVWTIEFFDSSVSEIKVPQDYSGTSTCSYTSSIIAYNPNDAINYAVHSLLSKLDIDSDRRIDTKFSEENFEITANEISGIPYIYSSEVQVRVWR